MSLLRHRSNFCRRAAQSNLWGTDGNPVPDVPYRAVAVGLRRAESGLRRTGRRGRFASKLKLST
jgi:hypothetical protein